MEITWLLDLKALGEALNFGRAARARNVTQPAFSRRIQALESFVGTPLVDRSTHRIALTAAGEAMLACARDVLARLESGRREALAAAGEAGRLSFCATHALSLTFLPAWLRRVGTDALAAPIHLSVDNMAACERMMEEGRAQFLLCHDHPAAPPRLDPALFPRRRLGTDRLVPVSRREADGRPRHALPGSPQAPVPLLAFDERSGIGRIVEAAVPPPGAPPLFARTIFASHLALMLKTLAADGDGIAFAPLSLLGDDLGPKGRLARAGGPDWDVPVDVVLVRRAGAQGAAAEALWAAAAAAEV